MNDIYLFGTYIVAYMFNRNSRPPARWRARRQAPGAPRSAPPPRPRQPPEIGSS